MGNEQAHKPGKSEVFPAIFCKLYLPSYMVNFYESVLKHPGYYRQFNCSDSLITVFNCPLEARLMKAKFSDAWSQFNYLFYVVEGNKIWHTARKSYSIGSDTCVFVRKGAWIFENFLEKGFCVVLFFFPDKFICDTIRAKSKPLNNSLPVFEPVMILEKSDTLTGFFLSFASYFGGTIEPDPYLLELKFKELILTIAENQKNEEILSYFCYLMHENQQVTLQRVMEDNFCYNLNLEQFAILCNRSLSSFKRDFQKIYKTTPGKWLLEKRLHHSLLLLRDQHKSITDVIFECGFESPSHFFRSFKARFNTTPHAFKNATY
ncbi:AraC family transcriptional regulator [Flavihumibacter rivuli]|uniref:helix-turn-helix domain-containing protein n=1 Tax=Flavihumibacter rivuli TaxID=2838156 RepID=UPI001BDF71B2|nr:AraC family transcriptional regulator [Flavihumibacter rivuli]ULQ56290.1 AraC family transcriptional regulator [Flavihumibacter rivuli]